MLVSASRFLAWRYSEDPRLKNDISGFIWHKSVIQTVKYSLSLTKGLFIKVSMARSSR